MADRLLDAAPLFLAHHHLRSCLCYAVVFHFESTELHKHEVPALPREHKGRPDTIRRKGIWQHLSNTLRSAPSRAVRRHDDRRVDLL